MSIIWDEVESIGARARELGIRPIYADAEEAQRAQLRRVEAAAIKRIFEELDKRNAELDREIGAEHEADIVFLKGMGWM